VQSANAPPPISVTEPGISILFRLEQLWNASLPIFAIVVPKKVTFSKFAHWLHAKFGILVTPASKISMVALALQLEHDVRQSAAPLPETVTILLFKLHEARIFL
jgi:hypothetical protein